MKSVVPETKECPFQNILIRNTLSPLSFRKHLEESSSALKIAEKTRGSTTMRNYTDSKHESIFQFQKTLTNLRYSTEGQEEKDLK